MKTKTYVELVMWETVRQDCKYPETDNNKGFIFGLNFYDKKKDGEIVDVSWFKSEKKRQKCISDCKAIIIND